MIESDIASRMGFSAATMRRFRDGLTEGIHWSKTGKTVDYTEAGMAEVEQSFGVPLLKKEDATPPIETALVTNVYIRMKWQPRLISATVKGEPVAVRVKECDRVLFAPGVSVKVRKTAGRLFECVGRPRRKGGSC